MTANPRTADFASPLATSVKAGNAEWSDARVFPLVVAALLVFFGLLQNRYWVPSGDSEVYISIARSIATGHGYRFNGQPVAMVPPGWPMAMAAVMKLTPYFLPLKLLAMACTIGFLAIGYWICRRFVSPGKATVAILLTAILSVVYPSTYWLISEGLFCLISAYTILLALQISEGKQEAWRIALLAVACAVAVTVRWAGVLGLLIVAAALVRGSLRPQWSRPWIALMLAGVLTAGTFFALRAALAVSPEEAVAAQEFGGAGEDNGGPTVADKQIATQYKLLSTNAGSATYADRFISWGRWPSFLFWQPFRATTSIHSASLICNAFGWILLALLMVAAGVGAMRGQWIWLSVLAYGGALALRWPVANARYLVPISFLLTLGVMVGIDEIRARLDIDVWRRGFAGILAAFAVMIVYSALSGHLHEGGREKMESYVLPPLFFIVASVVFFLAKRRPLSSARLWSGCLRAGWIAFVAGILICNLSLYAVELSVERSANFYGEYEAGLDESLISAARYLNAHHVNDRDVAVNSRYQNLGRTRSSPFGLRATALLTNREIVSVPWKLTSLSPSSSARIRSWLSNQKIKWLLYQPPVSPWRVGHLRKLGAWLEKQATHQEPGNEQAGWQLFRVEGEKVPQVFPPPSSGWPTRVPGL